jgi:hypothetical protein
VKKRICESLVVLSYLYYVTALLLSSLKSISCLWMLTIEELIKVAELMD